MCCCVLYKIPLWFDADVHDMETQEAVSLLQKGADIVGRITEISGMGVPTVIT